MTRKGWHILREEGQLTVARRLPVRFDVCAETWLPPLRKLPLAQQVRQDVWRALQRLRGFAPVVQVAETGAGLRVLAGGQVHGAFSKSRVNAVLLAVLDDAENRQRWIRWAQ